MAKQKDPRKWKPKKHGKVLEQAERALEHALTREEQVKNDLRRIVAEVVHDIKNPLNALIAYSEALKTEAFGSFKPKIYKDYAGTIHLAALRLLEYCQALVAEHTRITHDAAGPLSPEAYEDVDATAIIAEVVTVFRRLAEQRGIVLDCSVPPGFPRLHTLPTHFHRAMTNILANAVKFTPKGGNVTVGAEFDKKDDAVIMVIRDSGKGISGADIMRILNPDSHTAGPHKEKGTGLGLAIVNRLVRECGGTMSISSTEKKGTIVRLHFPRDATRKAAKSKGQQSVSKKKVGG